MKEKNDPSTPQLTLAELKDQHLREFKQPLDYTKKEFKEFGKKKFVISIKTFFCQYPFVSRDQDESTAIYAAIRKTLFGWPDKMAPKEERLVRSFQCLSSSRNGKQRLRRVI